MPNLYYLMLKNYMITRTEILLNVSEVVLLVLIDNWKYFKILGIISHEM